MQLSMKISIRFDTWIMFNFDQVYIVLNFRNLSEFAMDFGN
jgi:hypothetical protein